eukprot:PhM_4_TR2856/c0_g1_i2/m.92916
MFFRSLHLHGPRFGSRSHDSWGGVYTLGKHRSYPRLPNKYKRPYEYLRFGNRGDNRWGGACGVKWFGGAYGARLPVSGKFARATPDERRAAILGPFNLVNRTYFKKNQNGDDVYDDDDDHGLLSVVGSFPAFQRIFMFEKRSDETSEQLKARVQGLLHSCDKNTVVVLSDTKSDTHTVFDNNEEEIVISNESLLQLITRIVKGEQNGGNSNNMLCVVADGASPVNFKTTLQWYIKNNDPRRPLSSRAVLEPTEAHDVNGLKLLMLIPRTRRVMPKFWDILSNKFGFVRVKDEMTPETILNNVVPMMDSYYRPFESTLPRYNLERKKKVVA